MLSKATEYAIRALVYIAIRNAEGKRPGFKEIAQKIDSPEQFTAKILQTLARKGLINSAKGRGGGFFFKENSGELPLYSVVNTLEGDWSFSKCGFGLKSCDSQNPCPLHHEYLPIRQGLYNLLNKETIQSLAVKILGNNAILTRLNLAKI